MWETNNEPSRAAAITKYDEPETHFHAWMNDRFAPILLKNSRTGALGAIPVSQPTETLFSPSLNSIGHCFVCLVSAASQKPDRA